jgi:hypothetical protein
MEKIDWEKRMKDCEEKIKTWDERELDAFLKTNDAIGKLTSYGLREDVIPSRKFSILSFWNSTADWAVSWGSMRFIKEKKLKTARLDANQVIVPFGTETMEKIAPCLKIHPLYKLSSEAWMRGETPREEAQLVWAMKQLERIRYEKKMGEVL